MKFAVEYRTDTGLLGGAVVRYIVCNTCGERIDARRPGIVVFPDSGPSAGKDSGPEDLIVVHKGTCETQQTRDASAWQDLNIFLRDIVLNAGIDLAATEEQIELLGEYGLHN